MRRAFIPLLSFVLLVGFSLNVAAQQTPPRTATWEAPEFGKISEIAQLTKVYVYCEDFKVREELVRELEKEPGLEIVDRIDDSEFVINYTYRSVTWSTRYNIGITTAKTTTISGELIVSIAGTVDDQNRVHQRIVWSTSKDRASNLGKNPLKKAAKAFLEDYRRVRSTTNEPASYGAAKVAADEAQPQRKEAAKPKEQNKKEKPWYEMEKP